MLHNRCDRQRFRLCPPTGRRMATMQSVFRRNTPRLRPITIRRRRLFARRPDRTTGLTPRGDGNNRVHRNRHRPIPTIPERLRPAHRLPARDNPARREPTTTAHLPRRLRNHHNPASPPQCPDLQTRTSIRTVPAAVPVTAQGTVRGIDRLSILTASCWSVSAGPGVFAFAARPSLATSTRGHHPAAI